MCIRDSHQLEPIVKGRGNKTFKKWLDELVEKLSHSKVAEIGISYAGTPEWANAVSYTHLDVYKRQALGKTPQKDLVAEKSTYPALLGLEESKALLTSELDACEDLLDQITAACDFDPQAIKKLIEGLRIDG